jgi:hypothetical protein
MSNEQLSPGPVKRLVGRCREFAAVPLIYCAFLLLRAAAIVIGRSSPGTVGIFYDHPPNAQADRAAKPLRSSDLLGRD